MKKLILIIALFAIGMTAHAQTQVYISSNNNALIKTIDTVTNTGTKSMLQPLPFAGSGETVTVSTYNAVISGTMKGISTLWASTNGVDFSRVRSTTLQGAQVDSLLLDAAHPNYSWIVLHSPFLTYKVVTVGIGTTVFKVRADVIKH